jgi:dienelactone hydrolase
VFEESLAGSNGAAVAIPKLVVTPPEGFMELIDSLMYKLMYKLMGKKNFCAILLILTLTVAAPELLGQPAQNGTSAAPPSAAAATQPTANPAGAAQAGQAPQAALDPKTMTPLYETIQEDWSSLDVAASKLQPEPPLVGLVDDAQNTFTRTLVQVKWRPGDPIDLWIILPKGVKKPPAVLYLYNEDQDTDRFRDNRWCARVTDDGVAAIGFVSALSGHRFHDRPLKQWFVSELQESLGSTVHDVKFILDYLAQRGDVDMNRIGMFGEGSGGAIAILAAAADPRIKVVDTLDPWGDWPDFLAKSSVVQVDPNYKEFTRPEFLKRVAPLDPVKWLPHLKVPVRIQQVRQNEATPLQCKEKIKDAAPKQTVIVRFEAGMDLARREGHGALFKWIKDRLQEVNDPGEIPGGHGASMAVEKSPPSQMEKDQPLRR